MQKLPRINIVRIRKIARLVADMPIERPLNFHSIVNGSGIEVVFSDMYPPLSADGVIDFFFFAMMHNCGFWSDDGERYVAPVVGKWNGKDAKGSDLLWKMLCATWKKDAECFAPEKLVRISDASFGLIFSDDDGPMSFFDTRARRDLTRDYGRWFRVRRMAGQSPSELVAYANDCANPVGVLRDILTHPENGVPGYREDPLGKKAELLLMALANRPEKLLHVDEATQWHPMIDYHIMRIFLRMGCITLPSDWMTENNARCITTRAREEAIRNACFDAMRHLVGLSGRTTHELDTLFWSARRFCPEMVSPNCGACLLQSACTQATGLFQPVHRTTFY
jgi:hypothetical protein